MDIIIYIYRYIQFYTYIAIGTYICYKKILNGFESIEINVTSSYKELLAENIKLDTAYDTDILKIGYSHSIHST